jgi:type II secretory pathway component PulF
MLTQCLSAMAAFGPGWTLTVALIAATAALTYLVTKRAAGRAERII